jgi:hypothetical protein
MHSPTCSPRVRQETCPRFGEYIQACVKGGIVLYSHEAEIVRKLRLIEALKAELVTNVGQLFQAVAQNADRTISQALAGVVISCYVLGKRLGIDFADLDDAIAEKLSQNIKKEHEVEKGFDDYSEYQRHLRQKR